jgi:antitoxin MazE
VALGAGKQRLDLQRVPYLLCNYTRSLPAVKTKLIAIGNSRGVRLPKPLIEEAGLGDEVDLRVHQGAIIITSAPAARRGWAEAARLMHKRNEDSLLDSAASTHFDESEWKW